MSKQFNPIKNSKIHQLLSSDSLEVKLEFDFQNMIDDGDHESLSGVIEQYFNYGINYEGIEVDKNLAYISSLVPINTSSIERFVTFGLKDYDVKVSNNTIRILGRKTLDYNSKLGLSKQELKDLTENGIFLHYLGTRKLNLPRNTTY